MEMLVKYLLYGRDKYKFNAINYTSQAAVHCY